MTQPTDRNVLLTQRCACIEMLAMDVDGVLTDGSIIYTDQGEETKGFHVRDGSGLKLWAKLGKKTGIITGRRSSIVDRRARELDFTVVFQGVDDKKAAYLQMLREHGLTANQVCFVGDDFVDVPVLRCCGLAVAVADACSEAKQEAAYVTRAPGGRGAVREVVELILRAQGSWQSMLARYRDDPGQPQVKRGDPEGL